MQDGSELFSTEHLAPLLGTPGEAVNGTGASRSMRPLTTSCGWASSPRKRHKQLLVLYLQLQ